MCMYVCVYVYIHTFKKFGEIAQQLRTLAVLPKDQIQFPALTQWPTAICNAISRGPDALFWHPQTLYNCSTQTHTHMDKTILHI